MSATLIQIEDCYDCPMFVDDSDEGKWCNHPNHPFQDFCLKSTSDIFERCPLKKEPVLIQLNTTENNEH